MKQELQKRWVKGPDGVDFEVEPTALASDAAPAARFTPDSSDGVAAREPTFDVQAYEQLLTGWLQPATRARAAEDGDCEPASPT